MIVQWLIPVGFILAGLIGGVIGEQVVFTKIQEFYVRKKIPGNIIIFESFRRMTFIWFLLAGFLGAVISFPIKSNDVNDLLKRVIIIIFLYSVTLVFARLSGRFVKVYTRKTERVSASLISNVVKIAILILGTLIILQTVGIEVTPIVTTLGISGLAVGLALKDTLENIFSGFYLIFSKQVRTGDYVKLEDKHEGYVTDITWRNTTIKELYNNVIVVPNSKLASAIFTNYHLPVKEITLTINVGVDYESDLEEVEKVTLEVAKEVMKEVSPQLMKNEPFMRFHTFGDFSINFTVFLRVNEFFDLRIAKHKFIKKLHKRYQKEGIKIPFPVTELYTQRNQAKNGNGVLTGE